MYSHPTRNDSAAPRVRRAALILMVLLTVGAAGGCVYFNLFYNAQQNFKKAERENRPSGRGRRRGLSTSKRLYEDAIVKAQKIIDKHPGSKYYDDALFMIAVSYFRMDDYARAERRFRELLAAHAESEFSEEAQLYLARCRMKLGDEQAGFRTFTELAETAKKDEWRAEAIFQRGEYFADNAMHDSAAAAYMLIVDEYPKSERALEARLWAAEQLRLLERPLEAIDLYSDLLEDDDSLILYEALLGTAESWYEADEPDSGIGILEKMTQDERFADSIGTIRLVLADGLHTVGNISATIRQYQQISAFFPKTEASATAYFRLAEIRQFEEADLPAAKDMYDACRQENARGEWANLALARSAYITKLEQFRKDLGREDLAGRRQRALGPYHPADLPAREREAAYSPLQASPWHDTEIQDSLLAEVEGPPLENIQGPETPMNLSTETIAEEDTLPDSALLAEQEILGPPSDLIPSLGPPVNRAEAALNLIRDTLLTTAQWWSLIGRDSILGPPSAAYLYPFGSGILLGPPTPADSTLKAWAAAEANSPARLERRRRLEERSQRKKEYAEVTIGATTQLQLAELYRFDLAYPDSAVAEYENVARLFKGTPFAAQALIGAADVYAVDMDDSAAANSRLRQVLAEYPYTDYAADAIARLGLRGTDADTAHPAWAYAKAEEAFITANDPQTGVALLNAFVADYPHSRLVPTAEYAAVALTDKYFPPGDSSVIWAYQEIVAEYPQSDMATAAQARLRTTITRPKKHARVAAPVQDTTRAGTAADSLADSTDQERLPLAPVPMVTGRFVYPESEIGSEYERHAVVYRILIDFAGEIAQHETILPSPSPDINEAARLALEHTKFWADSIPPDSLNIWYRYEIPVIPPARELNEFDRLGIDPNDPRRSGQP